MITRLSILYFFICYFLIFFLLSCNKNKISEASQPPAVAVDSIEHIDSAETVYVTGGRSSNLFAINAKNGTLKWKASISGLAVVSPIYSNGKIIIAGSDNKVYAFDTSGAPSWTFSLNNTIASAPIANNGIVYISDIGSIYALNSQDGHLVWTFQESGTGYLTFNNSMIYFNADNLYAVDATNGKKKWQYYTEGGYFPVVSNGKVYCLTNDWTMLILNATTGSLQFGGGGWGIYSDFASFNVNYGNIYVLRATSGIVVTDTANPMAAKFGIPFASTHTSPSISPILADSLAILTWAVNNAITGEELYVIPGGPIESLTYYQRALYCVSWQKDYYDGYSAGYLYASVFAFDTKAREFLWICNIKDEDFHGVEPCIVTKSGVAYRGGFTFK